MAAGPRALLMAGVIAGLLFIGAVRFLDQKKDVQIHDEMLVTLPRFVQVLMSGGDRFLAANTGAIRALVADTAKLDPPRMAVLGRVQSDVAQLNPAHEDNYYVAAAILPWSGQLEASEFILHEAALARPFDTGPGFQYGFIQFYFRKNPILGADWLRFAATRTNDELERLQLEALASSWYSRAPSAENAISLLETMARNARYSALRAHLERRIARLRNLQILDKALDSYKTRTGHRPNTLQELVSAGLIRSIPPDPFGQAYGLSSEGTATLLIPQSGLPR